MKLNIILFSLIFTISLFSQEKYLIYFKDKGNLEKINLSKKSDQQLLAKQLLSEKSIDRRKKNMGDSFINFQDLPINQDYVAALVGMNVKPVHKLKWFNAVSAIISDDDLDKIRQLKFVDKIEKVRKLKSIIPVENESSENQSSQKLFKSSLFDYGSSVSQYQLSDIPQVHDLGITGEGVIIGILDSGFDWKTPNSLKNRRVIAEHDFIFNDNNTTNEAGIDAGNQHNHGTSVFSILAGFDDGNIVGPAFNSNFILAKTEYIPTETHTEEDNYAAALEWMDSIGVDITTSSLGYSEFDATDFSYSYSDMNGSTTIVTKAANLAFDRGITVITSAGNEGNNTGDTTFSWYYITAPGDGFNTLTIGAVSNSNIIASFSSRGPTFDGRIKPEVVAQGTSVKNALAGSVSGYSFGSGTSFSAPIVAGVAGLLLSAHPHLTNRQIRSIIINSGDNLSNPNNDVGYGLLSALKAVGYPNIEVISGIPYIKKIFQDAANIQENSIEVVAEDGAKLPVTKLDNLNFRVELPNGVNKNSNKIYFTYKDLQNNEVREPNAGFYNLYIDDSISKIEIRDKEIPSNFKLSQNYPNPFNPSTIIDFTIPEFQSNKFTSVQLKVYDILGKEVITLVDENKSAGNYSVEFNAKNLSAGVYFYRLQTPEFSSTKKLIFLK